MSKLLKMSRAAAILMLAAGMSLACQTVQASPNNEPDETAGQTEQNDTAAVATDAATQAADAEPLASDASAPAAQGGASNAVNPAGKTEKKGKEAAASIPSANPSDANSHPAWRKRESNKALGDLQKIRRSMSQQGGK